VRNPTSNGAGFPRSSSSKNEHRSIKGIYGREMYETWYKMTSMIQSGLDIRPVITHHFPYTDFQKAFDVMRSGNSGKVILHWEDE